MLSFFAGIPHIAQALCATLFTWGITALGAASVFFLRRPKRMLLDGMLAFSGGVMLAASYWSLLAPAIGMAEDMGLNAWLTPLAGFEAGGVLLYAGSRVAERRKNVPIDSGRKRQALLFGSITLHNIPEGLAVGVAFGALDAQPARAALSAACMLALGIGIQNFPEGAAVSLPLYRDGCGKGRAFFWGQLSAWVEPVSGVLGALLVLRVRRALPFLLAFAAGAMIYVVAQEIIPESQRNERRGLMTMITLAGFSLMMALDVALG